MDKLDFTTYNDRVGQLKVAKAQAEEELSYFENKKHVALKREGRNTPAVQQPRMTEAQRHDAFVQSLRENTANGKYGPVPTQSTARKAAAGSSEDGGRDRGDDQGAPGSQGRESGLKFGTSKSVSASQGSGKGRGAGLGQGGGRSGGGHGPGGHGSGGHGGHSGGHDHGGR